MSTRLEPVYLANVLLHLPDMETLKAFPFISKNCHAAMDTVRRNPVGSAGSRVATILSLFPNINTLVVNNAFQLNKVDSLPDTIASIVVGSWRFASFDLAPSPFASRVVAIHNATLFGYSMDLSSFSSLELLITGCIPESVTPPAHRLKSIRLVSCFNVRSSLDVFKPEWCDRLDIIVPSVEVFASLKTQSFAPNVHLFCTKLGEGVQPVEFMPVDPSAEVDAVLSPSFGADELRVFNDNALVAAPLTVDGSALQAPACDFSTLSWVPRLLLNYIKDVTVTLPTTLQELTANRCPRLTLVGGDALTSLALNMTPASMAPCPHLKELLWMTPRCATDQLPFPIHTLTSLTLIDVTANTMADGFQLPPNLVSLALTVREGTFEEMVVEAPPPRADPNFQAPPHQPLDLSALTCLTRLVVLGLPVGHFPISVKECTVELDRDTDLTALTSLTSLHLELPSDPTVLFPTQLEQLYIGSGFMKESNIKDVALKEFSCGGHRTWTEEMLQILPSTVKKLHVVRPEQLPTGMFSDFSSGVFA